MFNLVNRNNDIEFLKKNAGIFLDEMEKKAEGTKLCPFLRDKHDNPRKCLNKYCEHFRGYATVNNETGDKLEYYTCAHVQVAELLIELNRNIRVLTQSLKEMQNDKIPV